MGHNTMMHKNCLILATLSNSSSTSEGIVILRIPLFTPTKYITYYTRQKQLKNSVEPVVYVDKKAAYG
jgi:hypothetical protein